MFGTGFENRWYAIPGVLGLELSGDLGFRGPGGVRRTRHDRNGRPCGEAMRSSAHATQGRPRKRRVLLHLAVMSVVLDRELAPGEMVCHKDDDKRNNWPENLYLGDARSNAADSVRNGRRPTGGAAPRCEVVGRAGAAGPARPVPGLPGSGPDAGVRPAQKHDQPDQARRPAKGLLNAGRRISPDGGQPPHIARPDPAGRGRAWFGLGAGRGRGGAAADQGAGGCRTASPSENLLPRRAHGTPPCGGRQGRPNHSDPDARRVLCSPAWQAGGSPTDPPGRGRPGSQPRHRGAARRSLR